MDRSSNIEMMRSKVIDILALINPLYDYQKSLDFFEDHFLDSMDVIRLITHLDISFDINILSEDIIPQNLKSVDAICDLINQYKYEN
jgi:acyl carrier protein